MFSTILALVLISPYNIFSMAWKCLVSEFYYSFTADPESSGFTDLASIDPTFTGLNMTQGRTIGMGGIITTDNSIQYVANQGGAGASVSLTSTGDPGSEIIKGISLLEPKKVKILYELYRMFNMSLQPETRRMVWAS